MNKRGIYQAQPHARMLAFFIMDLI